MKQLALALVFAVAALAADVAGNWKATAEGPNGAMTRTFAFKVDGETLTGETVSSFAGKSVIKNGKVKGDEVTFTVDLSIQGETLTANYKGKVVSKDEIKFTSEAAGNTFEWVAKRDK